MPRILFTNLAYLTLAATIALAGGCGTTTNRAGNEQLLLSDAVDLAVAQIDFQLLSGQKVYLDPKFIETVKAETFVNAPYVLSSLRQQLVASGCRLQDKSEEADIIVEPRIGALGTNGHEIIYGMPRNNLLNSAAAVIPNAPPLPAIPEISLARVDSNSGVAKVLVFAYDRETRQPIWQSGVARAEATSRSSWVLGAGPFQRGSVHNGTRFAGQGLQRKYEFAFRDAAPGVPYNQPHQFAEAGQSPRIAEAPDVPDGNASGEDESPAPPPTESR
jgi:hypothetical protein